MAAAAAGASDGDVVGTALLAPAVTTTGACDAGDPEGVASGTIPCLRQWRLDDPPLAVCPNELVRTGERR